MTRSLTFDHSVLASCFLAFLTYIPPAAAQVTYSYNYNRNLRLGSSGADVVELQRALQEMGLLSPSLRRGFFGESTRAAVTGYQKAQNIDPADGIFARATRSALNTRTVSGPTRVVDFYSLCTIPTRLAYSGLFGHTEIEIVGVRMNSCLLRYGVESESPDANRKLDHSCQVPLRPVTFTLSDQVGIDLSPIERFCGVAQPPQ